MCARPRRSWPKPSSRSRSCCRATARARSRPPNRRRVTVTEGFDLAAYLARERARVERALEVAAAEAAALVADDLASAARHGVLSGGKRLRPVLCMAAYA